MAIRRSHAPEAPASASRLTGMTLCSGSDALQPAGHALRRFLGVKATSAAVRPGSLALLSGVPSSWWARGSGRNTARTQQRRGLWRRRSASDDCPSASSLLCAQHLARARGVSTDVIFNCERRCVGSKPYTLRRYSVKAGTGSKPGSSGADASKAVQRSYERPKRRQIVASPSPFSWRTTPTRRPPSLS